MKLGIIVQARMGSNRFPGKVMCPLFGKPLLGYLLERVTRDAEFGPVIVATSTDATDDPIAKYCKELGRPCFRGSLSDVADRLRRAAHSFRLDAFVRLSADSPLLDTSIVQRCLERFFDTRSDLVTNIIPRTFPRGQSVEVIRTSSFERAYELMSDPEDFEHVTRIFYRSPEQFCIENVAATVEYPSIHLAVDTQDDFDTCSRIMAAMIRHHWEYNLDEIVEFYQQSTGAAITRYDS